MGKIGGPKPTTLNKECWTICCCFYRQYRRLGFYEWFQKDHGAECTCQVNILLYGWGKLTSSLISPHAFNVLFGGSCAISEIPCVTAQLLPAVDLHQGCNPPQHFLDHPQRGGSFSIALGHSPNPVKHLPHSLEHHRSYSNSRIPHSN